MELDYREIGQNIRRYRQSLGMKQKDLAELIHVSDQHISHIENAHTKLSLGTLVAISNALEVDCNTLLGSTLARAKDTADRQKLLHLTERMDEKKLGLAIELCRALKDYELS